MKSEVFDFATINNATVHIDSIGKVYPLIWRFFPILDQDVDVLLVRDLDSHISRREVSAVNEFLNSSKDFHIMRDHPFHIQPIMGGLWGIRLTLNRTKHESNFRSLLLDVKDSLGPPKERNHDQ